MLATKTARITRAATRNVIVNAARYARSSRRSSASGPESKLNACVGEAIADAVDVFDRVAARARGTDLTTDIGDVGFDRLMFEFAVERRTLVVQHPSAEYLQGTAHE